jgi:hypothetical protein
MCCGRSKTLPRGPMTTAPRTAAAMVRNLPAGPAFEYIGRTALTVLGPVSRMPYHFDRPGARMHVDPRDAQGLVGVPVLRRLP